MKRTISLTKRKNQYGEYKIRYFENNKEIEEASYLTDDWEDAVKTFNFIVSRTRKMFKKIKQNGKTTYYQW